MPLSALASQVPSSRLSLPRGVSRSLFPLLPRGHRPTPTLHVYFILSPRALEGGKKASLAKPGHSLAQGRRMSVCCSDLLTAGPPAAMGVGQSQSAGLAPTPQRTYHQRCIELMIQVSLLSGLHQALREGAQREGGVTSNGSPRPPQTKLSALPSPVQRLCFLPSAFHP